MRVELGTKGIGGRNESWWTLVRDDEHDDFFIVHTWSYMKGLEVIPGEERTPILESKGHHLYEKAATLIRESYPNWKSVGEL